MPKIKYQSILLHNNPATICLSTENASMAELTELPANFITDINREYSLELKRSFYFNRLKATKYRVKEGTTLMVEVIKLALEYKFSIICDINPYDESVINLQGLISFYCSFGFKKVNKATVIFI